MNEVDALHHVRNKAYAENSAADLDDDDNVAPARDVQTSDGENYLYSTTDFYVIFTLHMLSVQINRQKLYQE